MPDIPQVPFPQVPVLPKKSWMKIILISLSGILGVVLVFILGYYISMRKCPTKICPIQPKSEPLSTFTSTKVPMTFQYPSSWGEVTEKIADIGSSGMGNGQSYNLTFTKNPYLTFMGASKDSVSPGIGGACPIRFLFKGTSDYGLTSCAQCNVDQEGCGACTDATIAGQTAVSYFYIPTAHCSAVGFQKVVYLKTPFTASDHDFPGLVIVMNISTSANNSLGESGGYATYGCVNASPDMLQSQALQLQHYNDVCHDFKTKFVSGDTSDYLTTLQLTQLQNLLSSLHFNP